MRERNNYDLSFMDIFNEPGLYQGEDFADGVAIIVDRDPNDIIFAFISRAIATQKYKKILNRNQLFSK